MTDDLRALAELYVEPSFDELDATRRLAQGVLDLLSSLEAAERRAEEARIAEAETRQVLESKLKKTASQLEDWQRVAKYRTQEIIRLLPFERRSRELTKLIKEAIPLLKVLVGYRGITMLSGSPQGNVYLGTVAFSPKVFDSADSLLVALEGLEGKSGATIGR